MASNEGIRGSTGEINRTQSERMRSGVGNISKFGNGENNRIVITEADCSQLEALHKMGHVANKETLLNY